MKLFVGETVLCPEVKEWLLEEYGYIDHIMIIYNEKDEDGKYIDEIIKGPFIVHHVNAAEDSVTFARVNPDNEYVPDGFAVTITKNILSKVMNVFITANDTNIYLFPHTRTVNPEISKMWKKCEKDKSDMYLKYHDPIDDKNHVAHVKTMFERCVIVDYFTDIDYRRTNLPKAEEHLNMDVDVIVW